MKRMLISLIIALGIISCGREIIPEDQETEVLINVQLPMSAPALTGLSQITAIVKASPQDGTIIAQKDLTITGNKATGTLMVLAGKQRVFVLEARDSDGQAIGSGQTTADVVAGQTITLNVTIEFKTGTVVINTTIPEGLPTLPRTGVFFEEDFSRYNDGQPASDWGEGLIVSVDKDTKIHYLSSEVAGKNFARKSIDFPDSFSFRFTIKLTQRFAPITLKFIDSGGQLFPIRFESWYDGTVFGVIWYDEGGNKKDYNFGDIIAGYNSVDILKKGKNYSLYFNGTLLALGTYEGYSNFEEIEIYASFDQVGFTNFVGQHLSQ